MLSVSCKLTGSPRPQNRLAGGMCQLPHSQCVDGHNNKFWWEITRLLRVLQFSITTLDTRVLKMLHVKWPWTSCRWYSPWTAHPWTHLCATTVLCRNSLVMNLWKMKPCHSKCPLCWFLCSSCLVWITFHFMCTQQPFSPLTLYVF